jgi:hypothetical protein
MALTTVDQGLLSSTAQYTGFKNRIINGAMVIDQRNAGASVTVSGGPTYTVDRWKAWTITGGTATVQQSSTTPTGSTNSLLWTVTGTDSSLAAGDYYLLAQYIEGYNTADLNWGATAASAGKTASPITVSFWVRSSVTGTFSGVVSNNGQSRSYPFTYTINSANTWEYKTATIPGDTSGTWETTNSTGIQLYFCLGVGSTYTGTANAWAGTVYLGATGQTNLMATNGATFYITGVQLEKGSTATSFDYRPYGTELYLCQRYYWPFIFGDSLGQTPGPVGFGETTTTFIAPLQYPQTMRATPTISTTNLAADFRARYGGSAITCSLVPSGVNVNNMACWLFGTVASGITVGNLYTLSGNASNVKLSFSSEL